jgi:hypothetical protein
MAPRDGFYSLRKVSRELCRLIVAFEPTIRRLYPNNAALHLALDAAMLACQELHRQVDLQSEIGV